MHRLEGSRFQVLSPEVAYLRGDPRLITSADLAALSAQARDNPRQRCRICLHRDPADQIHQMIIAHTRTVYVPPHAHRGREESFQVLSGLASVIFFTDAGAIERIVPAGDIASGRAVEVQIPGDRWHCQVFESEMTIFHEVTAGPFDPASSQRAPFAPADDDLAAQTAWLAELRHAMSNRSQGEP